MAATLADCSKVTGPFDRPIKVKIAERGNVTKYQGKDGEQRQSLTVAVSDGVGVVKVVIYDPTKFSRFSVGSSVTLRNVICRDATTLVVTRNSRVFLTKELDVSNEKIEEGRRLLNPPKAPFVTLAEGLASPPRCCVSIKGQVVQEDKDREVSVRNTPTKVKEVWLGDGTTKKAKVTLWRDQCATEFRAGDFIEITDVVTSSFRNETSFSLTTRSTVQVVDAPVTERQISVEGIAINGEEVELLTDTDEVVGVKTETVLAALPLEDDLELYFCSNAPVDVTLFSRGATVERIIVS